MKTNIQVTDEKARAELQRLRSTVDGPRRAGLMQVLGKGLEADLQDHFLRKNKKPNKRGFPKSNFWARIRTATNFASSDQDSASVAISDPAIRPHLFGATITPRNGKFLAIPARAEAYGTEPRGGQIPDLFFIPTRGGRSGLLARKEGEALRVYYFLVRRVRIPKDPDALPAPADLGRRAVERGTAHLDRMS